jgi:hypothetical protein
MIPVLGEGGSGVRYLCVACARALIARTDTETGVTATAGPGGPAADAAVVTVGTDSD